MNSGLNITYEMMKIKISIDPEMIETVNEKYQYCNSDLFKEMGTYIADNEQRINSYLLEAQAKKSGNTWPKSAKILYIDRCSSSLASQGATDSYARHYCTCVTNGMEHEFGMKEYDQMMKAEPNPSGSVFDQRLYNVFTACRKKE